MWSLTMTQAGLSNWPYDLKETFRIIKHFGTSIILLFEKSRAVLVRIFKDSFVMLMVLLHFCISHGKVTYEILVNLPCGFGKWT